VSVEIRVWDELADELIRWGNVAVKVAGTVHDVEVLAAPQTFVDQSGGLMLRRRVVIDEETDTAVFVFIDVAALTIGISIRRKVTHIVSETAKEIEGHVKNGIADAVSQLVAMVGLGALSERQPERRAHAREGRRAPRSAQGVIHT